MRTPPALALAAAALLTTAAFGGPISPPMGAVGPTMKTMTEVEPRIAINATNTPGDADSVYKITQPGSYYLTGNVTAAAGFSGIEIASANVTIDLGGFSILGNPGSLDGVKAVTGNSNNAVVRNGAVSGMGGDGIDLTQGGPTKGDRVEGVNASGNGGIGIRVSNSATVVNCSANSNLGSGIAAFDGCTVSSCQAAGNTGHGFTSNASCVFNSCSANGNGSDGFSLGTGNSVTACTAATNGEDGIDASLGSTVTNCASQYNARDGIRVASYSLVTGNNCESNGLGAQVGAGVHGTGSKNRIENNSCFNADVGIDVDNGGSIVIRNTCGGNTVNWTLATGTVYGPIVDRSGIASPPVSGNSAASQLTTTDPNANFTH
ncbi:MAG: right-handed parallel beta-helix repeat-containing protein [Phycisphaerales bacterium]